MIALLLLSLSCAPKAPAAPAVPESALSVEASAATAGVEDPRLAKLLSDHWEYTMRRSPVWATMLGDRRFDDRLGDPSEAGVRADREARRAFLERARAITGASLSESDALTLAIFDHGLRDNVQTEVCEFWQWSVSPRDNAYVDLAYLPELHTLRTLHDQVTLVARYRQIPAYVDAVIANLGVGLANGRVANRDSVMLTVEQIGDELAKPTDEWVFVQASKTPTQYPHTADETFQTDVRALVEGEVRAAFVRYHAFLRDEVLPAARPPEKAGLQGLPGGEACYEALVRSYTTLPLTADDLHTTGFRELESIHAEMRDTGERLFGTRDLATIFAKLREDPTLNYDTSDAVVADATAAVDAVRPHLPSFFGRLPQADVIVRPIPDHEAPYTTIAYYRQPVPDGSKPGEYFVNAWAPETRPRWQGRVLAFHEAIPGHHLQIAIAQELPELPAFRKHDGYTAFVEGWGLYSERLADEMGLYPTDLDRMGMLAFDSWRAARLVVDTGIHAKGWTRQESIAFFLANTALAENNVVNEVDRYVTTPGQALAYKTGQIRIRSLRKECEDALGTAFSKAEFHDVVLGAGAVPLPVLDLRVRAWLASRKGG